LETHLPRYDVPKAAPEPLRLVQLFVNTVDHEHGREWLGSPAELRAWLGKHLPIKVGRSKPGDLAHAIELREALRSLLRGNNGFATSPPAIAAINRAAHAAELSIQITPTGQVTLEPRVTGVEGALGRILAVALEAMLDGSWVRLKACRQCRWSYYDYSRNRSARWCSMSICGNRSQTRAYRRRRARA
jgi:predicted RNA-binding Zn ribbon-like protein